jgi:hypothetical protein
VRQFVCKINILRTIGSGLSGKRADSASGVWAGVWVLACYRPLPSVVIRRCPLSSATRNVLATTAKEACEQIRIVGFVSRRVLSRRNASHAPWQAVEATHLGFIYC